ncbi:hypothetical protein ACJIZ3_017803 [Penstemon smallii]|uniref:Uncharacterized protein n=1 Tax=Penstemon smallii TaxID=265156 RepID=A0ABD3SXE0_9LAMI
MLLFLDSVMFSCQGYYLCSACLITTFNLFGFCIYESYDHKNVFTYVLIIS